MKAFLKSLNIVVATSKNYFVTSEILLNISHKVRVITIGISMKNHQKFNLDNNKNFCKNHKNNTSYL